MRGRGFGPSGRGEDIGLSLTFDDHETLVQADPGQLDQVVMNLAVNARDAMPRGGKLAIEIANVEIDAAYVDAHHSVPLSMAHGPYVVMSVTDTGTGMDAATRERIFEPFFTTKEAGKGTGLGLSTVFAIVSKSHGFVAVDSELGHGTTLRVYLPRASAADAHALAPEAAPQTLTGTETVLVVEDDEQLRSIVRAVLRRHGYRVLDAEDGEAALRVGEQFAGPIQLLVTDVVMPKMSGRELAERFARARPETRVLYVSGYNEDTILQHGIREDGIDFLQKPVVPELLLRAVRALLDRPRAAPTSAAGA